MAHQDQPGMMTPELRQVFEGTPIVHLATLLPDGAPHVVPVWIGVEDDHLAVLTRPGSRKARNLRRDPRLAISIAPAGNPRLPILVRGRVIRWLDDEQVWSVADRIARKYMGADYPRAEPRTAALIRPEWYRNMADR